MKNLAFALVFALLPAAARGADEPENRLGFKVHGFSIAPLEAKSSNPVQLVLSMYLPATDGFSPNVNVQIQAFQGSIKDYVNVSAEQMKAGGFTQIAEKVSGSTAILEYAGELQGRKLHFYLKAEQTEGKVYLVTATAPEANWAELSAKLKACVESLKVDSGKPAGKPAK